MQTVLHFTWVGMRIKLYGQGGTGRAKELTNEEQELRDKVES